MNNNIKKIFEEWKRDNPPTINDGIESYASSIEECSNTLFIIIAFDFKLKTNPKILFFHCPEDESSLRILLSEVTKKIGNTLNQ